MFGAVLDDTAVIHEDHAISDLLGEAHLVGHAHHRHAVPRQFDHDIEDLGDHFWIERGRRFIEEHGNWIHCERARDGHALLLATGELRWVLVGLRGQADPSQQPKRLLVGCAGRTAQNFALRQREVLGDRQVWEQFKVLKHHADATAQGRQVGSRCADLVATDFDAARIEGLQTIDAFDQRRLARAGAPTDHDHLALTYRRRAVREHLKRAVALADILDDDHAKTPSNRVIEKGAGSYSQSPCSIKSRVMRATMGAKV